MEENNIITKKYKSSYTNSIVFLLIVIVSTTILYLYNNFTLDKIEKLKSDIINIEKSISKIEKEDDLQIYSLLEINKGIIASYNEINKISKYINHLNIISGKYGLIFTGFNLSNGEINTSVKVLSDSKSIAFQKTRDFIKKYRKDPDALFKLGFIGSVNGMDEIKFSAKFKINTLKNN